MAQCRARTPRPSRSPLNGAPRWIVRAGLVGLIGLAACTGAETKASGSAPAPADAQTAAAPATQAPVAAPILAFDGARAWAQLERQVAFGPRPAGSPALAETRRYLTEQLTAAGIAVREQPFVGNTPTGPVPMINLIGTIPGRRTDRIVIATHYDTKLFKEFAFVGASDGASSTAVTLELGRVLKQAPQPEFTIELLFLDGEEAVVEWQGNDHTYGSRHYVDAARQADTLSSIKALVLLDMVGDRALDIRRDANSTPWLVDLVWDSARAVGHRSRFPDDLTAIEDDHIPFVRAGVPSVDIIDLDYAAWHTQQDDLDHVSQESLQVVGDVVLHALPRIADRLASLK